MVNLNKMVLINLFKNLELHFNINTSLAITIVYDALKSNLPDFTKRKIIEKFDEVLGLDLLKEEKVEIPPEIKELAEMRWQAKQNKDWTKADEIRKSLSENGYLIKDSKDGYEILKS